MKITLGSDGSVSFEVNSAADAIALVRELQAAAPLNGELPDDFPPARPEIKPRTVFEAVHGHDESEEIDFAEAAEVESVVRTTFEPPVRKRKARTYEATPERLAAAKEMGLRFGSYQIWEFLVDNESRTRGMSVDDVMRRFKLTRSAAGQRLVKLVEHGYATRVSRGHYKPACK